MQRFIFLSFLFWFFVTELSAQAWKGRENWPDDFPRVEQTDKTLFYIQRNLNKHTIVYDLNVKEDGSIDPRTPIDNYWRRYENNGERKDLSWLEAWLAYGYRAKKIGDRAFRIKLRAHKERYITLRQDNGKWRAIIDINGEESYLTNIYAYADESGILPDVKHVDLYGVNVKTGTPMKERIFD